VDASAFAASRLRRDNLRPGNARRRLAALGIGTRAGSWKL